MGLDELLLITGLAPLLETNSRAELCEKLHATDASPSGAGGCFASLAREDWLALYELAEEKGQHVRLDWKGEEPPSSMRDARAVAAPLALKLNWTTLFSYLFFAGKHINLLELESVIRLSRRVTREGVQETAARGTCGFARGFGSRLKGTIELTKNQFRFEKPGFWCLAYDIALELVGVPTWANPADAPSRLCISPRSRSWICSVNHCRCPCSGRTCA